MAASPQRNTPQCRAEIELISFLHQASCLIASAIAHVLVTLICSE